MTKNNKGITMVSLIMAVILMLIIASTLVYNSKNSIELKRINNMYSDIKNLKEKILVYYSSYGSIPTKGEKYTNTNSMTLSNENDNENYYIIDLTAIENLNLNYGKGFYKYEEDPDTTDLYIINEKSYNIYYVAGIEMDGKVYYTTQEDYTNIEIPEWSNIYTETKEYTDINGDVAVIPAGFQVSLKDGEKTIANGLVIKNAMDSNEFVWIPCNILQYDRYAFESTTWKNSQAIGEYDAEFYCYKIFNKQEETNYFTEKVAQEEKESIQQNGGFYIARYETGIENGTLSLTENSSNEESWTGYTQGNLVVRKDMQVWNYITRDLAIEKAKDLYTKQEENVNSRLCSSYAWDTVLKFIQTENSTEPMNSTIGTYGTDDVKLTGQTQINNIYDLAGNVEEWTTENYSDTQKIVSRGGNYTSTGEETPSAYRNTQNTTEANKTTGFRIALFL